jgi:hypothetical protein
LASRSTLTRRAAGIFLSLWVSAALALAGCGDTPPAPVDAARGWFEALARLDLARVKELTCAADLQAIDEALASSGGLGSEIDLSGLSARIRVDLSGLTFEPKSLSQDAATVRVSGSLRGQPVDRDLRLSNEDGVWKVCTSEPADP